MTEKKIHGWGKSITQPIKGKIKTERKYITFRNHIISTWNKVKINFIDIKTKMNQQFPCASVVTYNLNMANIILIYVLYENTYRLCFMSFTKMRGKGIKENKEQIKA